MQTRCLDDTRLLQILWRQWSNLGPQRFLKCPTEERQRSSLRRNVGRSIISKHLQTYWQHWRVSTRCKFKSKKSWHISCKSTLRKRLLATRHLEQKIKDCLSTREIKTRTSLQWELHTKEKGNHSKNNSERTDCIRWITKSQSSFGDSSMKRTRKAKWKKKLFHLLRQLHRTEIRKELLMETFM